MPFLGVGKVVAVLFVKCFVCCCFFYFYPVAMRFLGSRFLVARALLCCCRGV